MKVSEHVERLLRQGKKPRELVELGFAKGVVTMVRRRLREKKASQKSKAPEGGFQAKNHSQPPSVSATAAAEVTALVAAAQDLGAYRRETCPHHEHGICSCWMWTSREEIPQGIGEPVLSEGEKPSWHIKPSPLYCAMCTVPVQHGLGEVVQSLQGDPLANAYYAITCKGCGSKGFVAAAIKCTKCGMESWRGWCPKQ